MGYWPPSNEMLRPWSTNPEQNPGPWIGEDWNGHGFDVYAFFPEFPPDGDPSNDLKGSEGWVGSPESDLRVDYQATSKDFWAILESLQPVILITTGSGANVGWQIHAIAGGSGDDRDPSSDWESDDYGPDPLPTEDSIDPRSWDAISTYREGVFLESRLPMGEIEDTVDSLGITSVGIDPGNSGSYLAGFLGLHGLYYAEQNSDVAAAGHIQVAADVATEDANALIEVTLETVFQEHPSASLNCP